MKLADPGLVHYYKTLSIDDPFNRERVAFIAPEQFEDLTQMTIFSDRYNFGMFLWELFSMGEKPHSSYNPQQIKKEALSYGGTRLPLPTDCPDEIYQIIMKCCQVEMDGRMDPKEIVREIRSAANDTETDTTYNTPTWPSSDADEIAAISDNHINRQIADQMVNQQNHMTEENSR